MSCGNPHEKPCEEVLALVYGFLDGEIDDRTRQEIAEHLDECGPCLRQYGLEQAVKSLVQRSCTCPNAPEQLRIRIVTTIRAVGVWRTEPRTD